MAVRAVAQAATLRRLCPKPQRNRTTMDQALSSMVSLLPAVCRDHLVMGIIFVARWAFMEQSCSIGKLAGAGVNARFPATITQVTPCRSRQQASGSYTLRPPYQGKTTGVALCSACSGTFRPQYFFGPSLAICTQCLCLNSDGTEPALPAMSEAKQGISLARRQAWANKCCFWAGHSAHSSPAKKSWAPSR